MLAFDASSMIYAWDNYPVEQFPPLWNWIAEQVRSGELSMCQLAFDEVANKTPECADWLKLQGIRRIQISNEIVQEAVLINQLLQIAGAKYHPKGVGENDVFIIATAKSEGTELVSDEARQKILPKTPSQMKIPAVCGLPQVAVTCLSFIELIKRSRQVFG